MSFILHNRVSISCSALYQGAFAKRSTDGIIPSIIPARRLGFPLLSALPSEFAERAEKFAGYLTGIQ
jgi:hypothetical protein